MLSLNKELQDLSAKFQKKSSRENFLWKRFPKNYKIGNELSFAEFLKELAKAKVNLALSQKAEWEDYFLAEQQKAISIKSQIDQTDKEIDQMVYELYGLTEEEIKIVGIPDNKKASENRIYCSSKGQFLQRCKSEQAYLPIC